jgi:hypothetical protein
MRLSPRVLAVWACAKLLSHAVAVATLAAMSVLLLDTEDLPVTLASLASKNLAYWNAAISVTLVYLFFSWLFKLDVKKEIRDAADDGNQMPIAIIVVGIFVGLCLLAASTYGV